MTHVDLLDPEKDYLIIVPINDEGVDELYRNDIFKDDYISKNMQYMVFHEDTYIYMENRLFDIINVEMDMLINMYEEEIVDSEKLNKLLSVVDMLIRNCDDKKSLTFMSEFRNLVQIAIDHKTVVGFYF